MSQPLPVIRFATAGFTLDATRSRVSLEAVQALSGPLAQAHAGMQAIERGEIKNPDEGRAVTHFTDRASYLTGPLFADVEAFFADLRGGRVVGSTGKPFANVIINGIGGSALGPQLVQYALRGPYWNEQDASARAGNPRIYFTDNTDPSGLTDVLAVVDLTETLAISISKSGGTQETRNNMLSLEAAYAAAGLDMAKHAAAITMAGSKLDTHAKAAGWLKVWPMADSIGGRTSVTAVVGHVPAAAAGLDFGALLRGATTMDEWTREPTATANPAYLLAALWYELGGGKGDRNMVIVPYSDRLVLMSKYLQQLVMESLGKEHDLDGKVVHQGLTVFGNKGGTDAHAYIQQLNDGRDDFFVTFIEILQDAAEYPIDDGLTMGDYLHTFLAGLTNALSGKDRPVVSMSFDTLDAGTLGMIIALYERAVACYAELIHINAFHQPGVEAYKKIATGLNTLARTVQTTVAANSGWAGSAADFAVLAGATDQAPDVAGILAKYAVNGRRFGGHPLSRSWAATDWHYTIG